MAKRHRRVEDLPTDAREHVQVLLDRLASLSEGGLERVGALLDDVDQAVAEAVNACRREGLRNTTTWTAEVRDMWTFVGENVKALRDKAGWTQAEVTKAMTRLGFKWSRITTAEVERGGRRLTLEELVALAALFGQPVVMLLAPHDPHAVKFPLGRALDAGDVAALLVGPGAVIRPGSGSWEAARRVAGIVGDDDWRPVADLDRQRAQGYGEP
jgi:transcriptional regulator with XRE-family HTH domain